MRGHIRAIPEDFAQVAPTKGLKALQAHYRTADVTLRRWIKESGVNALPIRRACPDDLADLALTMTRRRLMKHFMVNARTMTRWLTEAGVTTFFKGETRGVPIPDDLAERAAVMTVAEMVRHYGVHNRTVWRWLKLTGLEAAKYVRPVREPKPRHVRVDRGPVRPATHRGFAGPKSAFVSRLSRDDSREGRAADHLRKFCAVYRCTETGRADPKGPHWRYGNAVLTGDEMIARAERHGWSADGWRVLPGQGPQSQMGAGA